jgi:hypothetical protein
MGKRASRMLKSQVDRSRASSGDPDKGSEPPARFSLSGKWRLAILVVVLGVAVATILWPLLGSGPSTLAKAPSGSVRPLPPKGIGGGSYLLIRSTSLNKDYGLVGLVASSDPQGPRMLSSLHCDRVDFEGGRGLCLRRATSFLGSTEATVFDDHMRSLRTVELSGYPSRARVSPDGRYGATTTFVSGDSYATMGQFSTRTDIIDLSSGRVLFNLEKLDVSKDGQPFRAADFNFWGVTFAKDGHTFYATLGTGGATYLLKGDLATRQAVVLASGVECPSLSPDGTRIAFKARNPGSVVTWRVSVLDLATMQSHPLAETRDVDDQPAWLNNNTVMYGLVENSSGAAPGVLPALTTGGSIPTDTWATPANGSGTPQLLVRGAWSTVVAHP